MTNYGAYCAFECYYQRYDLILGLPGPRATGATRHDDSLQVATKSKPIVMSCPGCGVIAQGRGRQAFSRSVR